MRGGRKRRRSVKRLASTSQSGLDASWAEYTVRAPTDSRSLTHCVPSQVLRLGGYLQDPLRLAGSEAAGLLPQQGQRARHRHGPHRAGEDGAGVRTLPGGQQVKTGQRR